MEGIFYKDGVYVVIDRDVKHESCILHYNYKNKAQLYGGRIEIVYQGMTLAKLSVDGISIVELTNSWQLGNISYDLKKGLSLSMVAANLNAIEANGVDGFIKNYKQSIEFLFEELKGFSQKAELQLTSEQNDSRIEKLLKEIEKIRLLLFYVLIILFNLSTHMMAALENEKVISIYQSLIDTLN